MIDLLSLLKYLLFVIPIGYLVYYVREKAKNQASHEDIKELTEIVELVKQQNSKEIELLKTSLNVLSNRRTQIFQEEKEAIVRFYEQLSKWYWHAGSIQYHEYNCNQHDLVFTESRVMRQNYLTVNELYARLELIVSNGNLIAHARQAIRSCLTYHQTLVGITVDFSRSLETEWVRIEKEVGTLEYGKLDFLRKYGLYSPEHKVVRKQILDRHTETCGQLHKDAITAVAVFRQNANYYLRKSNEDVVS